MKFAIVGSEGQLGRAFCHQLDDAAVKLDLPEFDMTERDRAIEYLLELRPDAVINCAAYTLVDQAEQESELCERINATGVSNLVAACRRLRCPLVQISTDYVFGYGSRRDTPWRESDEPHPQGVYALSKLHGEQQAAQWEKHFVIRTCGLYGKSPRNNNFVETMLRLGSQRDQLRVVNDQHCTPTYVAHLAAAILFLLKTDNYDIYHIVNAGATTWYEFAGEIFRQAGMPIELQPITTAEYSAAAPRPAYSVLDTGKYRALGGPEMPPWRDALAEYLAARTA